MSIETLRHDLSECMQEARALTGASTIAELVTHLQLTLWPLLASMSDELADIDEGLGDLYEGAEDILQPDTGRHLLALIAGAGVLVGELEKRVGNDQKILLAIREWKALAKRMAATVQEVTIDETESDEEDETEEEEGGDEGDGDTDDDDEGDGDDDDGHGQDGKDSADA